MSMFTILSSMRVIMSRYRLILRSPGLRGFETNVSVARAPKEVDDYGGGASGILSRG